MALVTARPAARDARRHADAVEVAAGHGERRRQAGAHLGDQIGVAGAVLRHRVDPALHADIDRVDGQPEHGGQVVHRPGQQLVVGGARRQVVAEPPERQPQQLRVSRAHPTCATTR